MATEGNQYDVGKGAWVVYGLLANRHDSHDLRFLAQTDDPEETMERHREEYEACCAYKLEPMKQLDRDPAAPGIFLHHGLGKGAGNGS